jgi:hypothetical protein
MSEALDELGDLSLEDDAARFAELSRAVRADLLEIADICVRDQTVHRALQIVRESQGNQDAVLAFARSSREEQNLHNDVERLGRLQQIRALDTARLVNAWDIAQVFVDTLMNDAMHEEIPDSDGMTYVRRIPRLEDHKVGTMVVRKITIPFWQACVRTISSPGVGRVAVLGTPGIGKSTCTPMLIRALLQEGKTVVYHVVKEPTTPGWLYEFAPRINGEGYHAQVYPESLGVYGVPSLALATTYYVVDPGETKIKCHPSPPFEPKLVLVASPDSRHWGDSEFQKERGKIVGRFMYFPVWSKSELWPCNGIIGERMSEDDFNERYRWFGGVPRKVFAPEEDARGWLETQNFALNQLTVDQVTKMGTKTPEALNSFSEGQPKSSLMGYDLAADDDGTFRRMRVILLSEEIIEKLWSTYHSLLWNLMLGTDSELARYMFESYVRTLLVDPTKTELVFQYRWAYGKRKRFRHLRSAIYDLKIPACTEIRLVDDPVASVTQLPHSPLTLFHSTRANYELIDCIFSDNQNRVHAIQITTGKNHDADLAEIRSLVQKLSGFAEVFLYYFVPSDIFRDFVTKPADLMTYDICTVVHIAVPNPAKLVDGGSKEHMTRDPCGIRQRRSKPRCGFVHFSNSVLWYWRRSSVLSLRR